MLGLILLVMALICVAFYLGGSSRREKYKKRQEAIAVQKEKMMASAIIEAENRAFINAELSNHLVGTVAHTGDQDGYIAVTPDRQSLAVYHVSSKRPHEAGDLKVIPAVAIRSVEIEKTTKKGVKIHIDRIPITTQQKKSAGGRALIGAVALGPVGLVAGAASGLNKKSTTKIKEVKRREVVDVPGPDVIVVGTNDLANPIIRIRCRDDQTTQEWAHRLEVLREGAGPVAG